MEAHSPVSKAKLASSKKEISEEDSANLSETWKDVFSPQSIKSIKRSTTVSQLVSGWEQVHKQNDPRRNETNEIWRECKNLDSPINDGSVKSIGDLAADPPTLYLDEITHFKIPLTEEYKELHSYLNALFSSRATKFDYLRVGIYGSKHVKAPLRVIALVSPAREGNTYWLSVQVKAEDAGYEHHHIPAEQMCGLRKIAFFSHSKSPNEDKKFMDREWNIIQYDLLNAMAASRDSRAASISSAPLQPEEAGEQQPQEPPAVALPAVPPVEEDHQTPLPPELRHTLPIVTASTQMIVSPPPVSAKVTPFLTPPPHQHMGLMLGEEEHQSPLPPELRHNLPIVISERILLLKPEAAAAAPPPPAVVGIAMTKSRHDSLNLSHASISEASSSNHLSTASEYFKEQLNDLEVKATTDKLHSELLDELNLQKVDRIWCSERYFLAVSNDVDGEGHCSSTILAENGKVLTTEALCCLLDDHLFEWTPGVCLKDWLFKKTTGIFGFGSKTSKRYFVLKDNLLLYSFPPNPDTIRHSIFGKKPVPRSASSKGRSKDTFFRSSSEDGLANENLQSGGDNNSNGETGGRRSLFRSNSFMNVLESFKNPQESIKRKEKEAELDIKMKFDKGFVIQPDTVIEELKKNTVKLSSPSNKDVKPMQLTFKTPEQQQLWLEAIREVIKKQTLKRDSYFKTTTTSYYPEEIGKLLSVDVKRIKGIEVKAALFMKVDEYFRTKISVRLGYNDGITYNVHQVAWESPIPSDVNLKVIRLLDNPFKGNESAAFDIHNVLFLLGGEDGFVCISSMYELKEPAGMKMFRSNPLPMVEMGEAQSSAVKEILFLEEQNMVIVLNEENEIIFMKVSSYARDAADNNYSTEFQSYFKFNSIFEMLEESKNTYREPEKILSFKLINKFLLDANHPVRTYSHHLIVGTNHRLVAFVVGYSNVHEMNSTYGIVGFVELTNIKQYTMGGEKCPETFGLFDLSMTMNPVNDAEVTREPKKENKVKFLSFHSDTAWLEWNLYQVHQNLEADDSSAPHPVDAAAATNAEQKGDKDKEPALLAAAAAGEKKHLPEHKMSQEDKSLSERSTQHLSDQIMLEDEKPISSEHHGLGSAHSSFSKRRLSKHMTQINVPEHGSVPLENVSRVSSLPPITVAKRYERNKYYFEKSLQKIRYFNK